MQKEKIDYSSHGVKCGLEIHQQLDTAKLFCSCASLLRSNEPDYIVKRKLHAIAGESGEVDAAAKHEAAKDKSFVYQGYSTTCLVELDEEPPHLINAEALRIALQIAVHLNCRIIPVTQIMRKTVINGSNTSGFQRTVFIARDGYIETSFGRVGIDAVFLEEDSARPVSKNDNTVVYRLDRLGIPMIEIATAPDIKSAEQAKEAALHIGDILRSCKVRRGIGTIRQDINISIRGSNRVELKGFQDPKMMIISFENEVMRQKSLLELAQTIPKAGKIQNIQIKDLTDLISPKINWIAEAIQSGESLIGFKLENFQGILGKELFSGYRLGTELSGYAKTRGFGGIIHSDENLSEKYKISSGEIQEIRRFLGMKDSDAFILAVGKKEKAESMIQEVLLSCIAELKDRNPSEVRNTLPDGKSEFLRPMPGQARMYPETDLPLLKISRDLINDVKKTLPKLRGEIQEDLRKQGLSSDLIKMLFKQDKLDEYKELIKIINNPMLAGKILLILPKDLATKNNLSKNKAEKVLNQNVLAFILESLRDKKINETQIKEVMLRIAEGKNLQDAIVFEKKDESEIEEQIMKIIRAKPGLAANAYMGIVMRKLKGAIQGREAMEIIQKFSK